MSGCRLRVHHFWPEVVGGVGVKKMGSKTPETLMQLGPRQQIQVVDEREVF